MQHRRCRQQIQNEDKQNRQDSNRNCYMFHQTVNLGGKTLQIYQRL
jgi:hypothetical protein